MTIKKIKPMKSAASAKPAAPDAEGDGSATQATTVVASPTGATIADRFKLDVPDASAKKGSSVSKTAATIALVVGFISLAVAGILTFVLYQHWDFLCNQVA